MSAALLTDLYEITMAPVICGVGWKKAATFSLFVRDLPPTRGFLVAAGLEQCLSYLENLRFEEQDLAFSAPARFHRGDGACPWRTDLHR